MSCKMFHLQCRLRLHLKFVPSKVSFLIFRAFFPFFSTNVNLSFSRSYFMSAYMTSLLWFSSCGLNRLLLSLRQHSLLLNFISHSNVEIIEEMVRNVRSSLSWSILYSLRIFNLSVLLKRLRPLLPLCSIFS